MPKRSTCYSKKFAKVMREHAKGTLHSGSGGIVKSRTQAQAIAHSEAKKLCEKKGKRKK